VVDTAQELIRAKTVCANFTDRRRASYPPV